MPLDADCEATDRLGSPPTAVATRWFAAHELRTPLQGIQGGVALLLEERAAGLSALQLEALSLIASATADLERCITFLAELAALADTPPPAPEKVALGALVAASEARLELPCGSQLATPEALDVLVAPELACRALHHLTHLARLGGMAPSLACELESIEDDAISLCLPLAPSASGDGAVIWHLATTLMHHAGARLQPNPPARSLLTLRRARKVPI